MADIPEFMLLADDIRRGAGDIREKQALLLEVLAGALPGNLAEVKRQPTIRQRLSGQRGRATEVRLTLGSFQYILTADTSGLAPTRLHISGGIVIGSEVLNLGYWIEAVMAGLRGLAETSQSAQLAVNNLLGLP